MSSKLGRFLVLALAVVLAAVLQLKLKPALGWTPDFLLVALIAVSFYSDLPQFIFLTALGVWFLNWQPGLHGSMLFYAAIPLAVFFLRQFLPWRPWFVNLILGLLGIAVFYFGAAGYAALAAEPRVLLEDIFWSSLFGFAVFLIMKREA